MAKTKASRRRQEAAKEGFGALTIRDVMSEQLEQVNADRKELSRWSLHRTPSPTKRESRA